jgi:DNA polymerase III delta subunit
MPKLEPKIIQKELDQEILWPVYWLYGSERMKSRELLKRIRKAALPDGDSSTSGGLFGMAEETLDGNEQDAASVVEAANSLSLSFGGGPSLRFIVVRDAHLMKNPEQIAELMGEKKKRTELNSVCVFLSKDFDQRKKISKLLLDKAAVVPCDEITEAERESWVQYLAKRRGLNLSSEWILRLTSVDPWTLDIIDQELEKFTLDPTQSGETFLGGLAPGTGSDAFLDAFFSRDLRRAFKTIENFATQLEEALPLLGLFAWNVRHLALILADQKAGTRVVKLNPYAADKIRAWSRHWTLDEVLELQTRLQQLDFGLKQTPLLPVGLWSDLVIRFCR